jgi:hypothetical protein
MHMKRPHIILAAISVMFSAPVVTVQSIESC